jgi:hypothetical protein
VPHRKDVDEEWAIAMLQRILNRAKADRDALPGAAVKLMKDAQRIMLRRRR